MLFYCSKNLSNVLSLLRLIIYLVIQSSRHKLNAFIMIAHIAGYIYSITCRCMCISWSYSFVLERLALLQRTTIFPMRQVPNLYCFGIYVMVPPCHFFSCHVLAFGQCMNHSTSITVQYSSFYLVNIVISRTHLFFLEMPEFSLFYSELLRLTHKIVAILCCNHLFCRTEDWEKLREEILFCRSICCFCIDDWKQILFLMKTPL